MKPLLGKKVLITRGKEQAKEFSEKIIHFGGNPIEIPLLSFVQPENSYYIEKALHSIEQYDWIVFTSKNGVDYFFKYAECFNIPIHELLNKKFAVVGKKTENALQAKGIQANIVPEKFVAEELLNAFSSNLISGERILLARGNLGRSILPEGLEKQGAIVTDLIVYKTIIEESTKNELISLLKDKQLDVITFLSPSSINNFTTILNGLNWREWIQNCKIACIGPVTKKQALAANIPVHVCPEEYTITGMLEALILSYYDGIE